VTDEDRRHEVSHIISQLDNSELTELMFLIAPIEVIDKLIAAAHGLELEP
jgi:hypothetical protein